jgi:hypothetical protein
VRKNGQAKFGGNFTNELDAGKKVNQLCEEMRIPLQNPDIGQIQTQQSPVAKSFFFFCYSGDNRNIWSIGTFETDDFTKLNPNDFQTTRQYDPHGYSTTRKRTKLRNELRRLSKLRLVFAWVSCC